MKKYLRIYESPEKVPHFTYGQLKQESFYKDLSQVEKKSFKMKLKQAENLAIRYKRKNKDINLFVRPETGELGVMFKCGETTIVENAAARSISDNRYFSTIGNSMNDGSSSSILPGDVLCVKESLRYHSKPKREELINELGGSKEVRYMIEINGEYSVGLFSGFNPTTGKIKCRFLNLNKSLYPDLQINISDISRFYIIESVQRHISPLL